MTSLFTCSLRHPFRVLPKPTRLSIPLPRYRPFHHTTSRLLTLTDPTRPSLYYHLLPTSPSHPSSPSLFALSFLPHPPATPQSASVIGYLPAVSSPSPSSASESQDAAPLEGEEEEEGLGLNDFLENPSFLPILHEVVRSSIASDPWWSAEAMSRGEGYMPIHDTRNPPMPNRTPEPEDTLGMVMVQEGKILPETYEPMPTYRVCTTDGVVSLTEEMEKALVDRLRGIEEQAQAGVGKVEDQEQLEPV